MVSLYVRYASPNSAINNFSSSLILLSRTGIRADMINELILKLQGVLGTTAVVVTHDMASARKVGTRIVMLHGGRFIADTTPAQLDAIDNDVVAKFVEGRAGDEDLDQLEHGQLRETPQ